MSTLYTQSPIPEETLEILPRFTGNVPPYIRVVLFNSQDNVRSYIIHKLEWPSWRSKHSFENDIYLF